MADFHRWAVPADYCMLPFIWTSLLLRHFGQKKWDRVDPMLMSMVLRHVSSKPHCEHFFR